MAYELEGTVQVIMDTQTFPSGFAKREFVVEKEDKYPQPIKFVTIKDKMTIIEDLKVGDRVKVFFDVRGNENNGRYYVDLNAWKIESSGAAGGAASSDPRPEDFGDPEAEGGTPDEVPF